MSIEIELFGQLLPQAQRTQVVSVKRPMLVENIADLIGLPLEEVGLITIDGVQSAMDDLVKPGCRLCFFPYMTGG